MSRLRILYRHGKKVYEEKDGVVLFDDRRDVCHGVAPMIMGDIKPYKSVIDGREITSRSRHREHLKANNCIEVGNERPKPRQQANAPGLKQDVIAAYKGNTGKL